MEIQRSDRFKRKTLNKRIRISMRKLRENASFLIMEKRRRKLSKDIRARREILRAKIKAQSQSMEERILEFRQRYVAELKQLKARGNEQQKQKAKISLKFIEDRAETPKYVCICCECLFFYYSVRKAKPAEIEKLVYAKSKFVDTTYICTTCRAQSKKDKVPTLKVTNGLEFPDIPKVLQELTPLEERMVSPVVPFMQIRDLMPFALNPQLGIKGSVVNIPVEIPEMVQTLPRLDDKLQTIQLKFKRHETHARPYMFEAIVPDAVVSGLEFLREQELYIVYNIKVDELYMAQNKHNFQPQNVIIDPIDEIKDMEEEKQAKAVDQNAKIEKSSSSESSSSESDDEAGDSKEKDSKKKKEKKTKKKKDLNLDQFDFGDDDDALLFDMNEEIVKNTIISIAPGQNKKPLSWLIFPNIDELCFPKIFAGQDFNTNKLSYTKRVKSELKRADRRSSDPTRVLFMARRKQELEMFSNINVCLRKVKGSNLTAGNVMSEDFVNDLVQHDAGYRMLANIRGTPAYWEKIKKDIFAMFRQLGRPTLFLTVSPAEKRWPELMQVLYRYHYGKDITVEEAMKLDDATKTLLIRKDPTLCAQYFQHKNKAFMQAATKVNGLFGENEVIDSLERVEMQKRGSPHEHKILWLKGAPLFEPGNKESEIQVIEWVDGVITCKNDPEIPYISCQNHKHTFSCLKGKKKECRFGIPLPMMPETKILYPLEPTEVPKEAEGKKNFKKIQKLMKKLWKKPREVSFDDVLAELEMTENEYMFAVRCKVKSAKLYLKRGSLDVGTNAYNKDILCLFESNMDIQFVMDEFAVAAYIVNYISKSESGLSKLLRQAVADANAGNLDLRQKFRKISNVFINGSLLSAQEAVYLCLSMPLSKFSRDVVFINTGPIDSRVRMMKSKAELEEMDKDDSNIAVDDAFAKYAVREGMDELCLADFVATKTGHKSKDGKFRYTSRLKPRIIRYVRYSIDRDAANFFREQCLLFLPWRNEKEDIETKNCGKLYAENKTLIQENQQKYVQISEDKLDEILKELHV